LGREGREAPPLQVAFVARRKEGEWCGGVWRGDGELVASAAWEVSDPRNRKCDKTREGGTLRRGKKRYASVLGGDLARNRGEGPHGRKRILNGRKLS